MTSFPNDLDNKSDDELIAIVNDKIPNIVSAKSTIERQDITIAAAAELHRRKKEHENKNLLLQPKNLSLQKWILRATIVAVIIAAITLGVVLLQFFQHPVRVPSNHGMAL